jgi:hypothetical protein
MEQGEVGQVIATQGLIEEVCVHEPQASEALASGAVSPEIGKENSMVIAADHMLDPTSAIDQHPHLPA